MTPAELVGQLAAEGAFFRVEGARLRYHGPGRLLTDHLRSVVEDRREELVTFLLRAEDGLTDEELDALGYRRACPGARILGQEDDLKPGWSPPPDWGLEGR
jgi:hypothetical protein